MKRTAVSLCLMTGLLSGCGGAGINNAEQNVQHQKMKPSPFMYLTAMRLLIGMIRMNNLVMFVIKKNKLTANSRRHRRQTVKKPLTSYQV